MIQTDRYAEIMIYLEKTKLTEAEMSKNHPQTDAYVNNFQIVDFFSHNETIN